MATATKHTEKVPVTTYVEKITSVTLELSPEEAQELRNIVSNNSIANTFQHISEIRRALTVEGFKWQEGKVTGFLRDVK